MLIWYFSNNLDIYDYVGKLPEHHFSVWLFSNPGDKIIFLLKFNEARISEWNVCVCPLSREGGITFFGDHKGLVLSIRAKTIEKGVLTCGVSRSDAPP